ncbi:MFS transporter [Uruburuella testudinis]|uniref:MFS transporter n=1 Tax=Uruburuella testudinis TaxID=1282863 RepID=A0ABY4DRC4_9NEIS|nr:MFS transporter [Uruburuella testudinis]UOO81589.1 MFS transporter [Uruburuella testudinis]
MDLRTKISTSRMGGYQWLIVILCFLLNVLDGFDVLALAFTAASIREEFGLSGAEIGTLMSAGLLGMSAGSLLLAPQADRFGRRPLLIVATALSALGMGMSALADSTASLGLWRVVTGLGVGGILACTNVITSEYSSNKWRGLAISVYAAGFGIGAVLGGISAVFLQEQYGWRAVFATGAALTALVGVALLIWLPESVDFLMSKRPAGAKARLNQIAAKIGMPGDWDIPATVAHKKKAPVLQLFTERYRRSTLLIWAAFVCIMFGFYFVSSWTPALLEQAGMTKAQSQTVGMMLALGGTAGSLLFGGLTSRWPARSVLVFFCAASAAAIWLFVGLSGILALAVLLGVLVGGLMNGCITGLYTINPTLFDADVRSTGVGTGIGIGRLGAIASPLIAGILLDGGWTGAQLYAGAAFVVLLAALAVWLLGKPRKLEAV